MGRAGEVPSPDVFLALLHPLAYVSLNRTQCVVAGGVTSTDAFMASTCIGSHYLWDAEVTIRLLLCSGCADTVAVYLAVIVNSRPMC